VCVCCFWILVPNSQGKGSMFPNQASVMHQARTRPVVDNFYGCSQCECNLAPLYHWTGNGLPMSSEQTSIDYCSGDGPIRWTNHINTAIIISVMSDRIGMWSANNIVSYPQRWYFSECSPPRNNSKKECQLKQKPHGYNTDSQKCWKLNTSKKPVLNPVPLIPDGLFQNRWRRTQGELVDPGSRGKMAVELK